MAKRKRDSVPSASPATATAASATAWPSPTPAGSHHQEHTKGPQVLFQLADESKVWKGKLKHKKTFDKWVPKVIDRLGLQVAPTELRLAHVREGGREVDIIDEYDFSAFKSRALASSSQSQPLVVKVYPPATASAPVPSASASTPHGPSGKVTPQAAPATPVASPTPAKKTPKKAGVTTPVPVSANPSASPTHASTSPLLSAMKKGKGKERSGAHPTVQFPPSLQTSSPSSPATPSQPAPPKNKKRKRASDLASPPPSSSPTSPSTQSSMEPKKKKRKAEKKAEKKAAKIAAAAAAAAAPAVASSPSLAATLPLTRSQVISLPGGSAAFINKYKPVRPSPLGRMDDPLDAAGASVSGDSPVQPSNKAKKARHRREKKLAAASTTAAISPESLPSARAQAAGPSTPQTTPVTALSSPSAAGKKQKKDESHSVTSEIMRKHREAETTKQAEEQRKSEEQQEAAASALGASPSTPGPTLAASQAAATPAPAPVPTPALAPAPSPPAKTPSKKGKGKERTPQEKVLKQTPPVNRAKEIMRKFREEKAKKEEEERAKKEEEERKVAEGQAASGYTPASSGVSAVTPSTPASAVSPVFTSAAPEAGLFSPQPAQISPPDITSTPTSAKAKAQAKRKELSVKKADEEAKKAAEAEAGVREKEMKRKGAEAKEKADADAKEKAEKEAREKAAAEAEKTKTMVEERKKDSDGDDEKEDGAAENPVEADAAAQVKEDKERLTLPSLAPHEATQSPTPAQSSPKSVCIICHGPDHPHKNCPVVNAGVSRLREVLLERETVGDQGLAVEAIKMWIERLGRITSAVKGNGISPARKPTSLPLTATPAREPVRGATPSASSDSESEKESPSLPQKAPSPAYSFPPIHMKAMSRKAGSISGLSVSDAVIETGSSESDSSDDEEDSSSGSEEDSDEEDEDDDISKSDEESENEQPVKRTRVSRSPSTSSASSSSSSSSSPSPPPPDFSGLDTQAALRHFLTAPLSQRQRRQARMSAASMQSVNLEAEEASEVESSPEPAVNASFSQKRRGSESSVGEFAESDEEEQSENEKVEDVAPPSFSQPPDILPSQPEGAEALTASIEESATSVEEDPVETIEAGSAEQPEVQDVEMEDAQRRSPSRSPSPPASSGVVEAKRKSFQGMVMTSPLASLFPGDVSIMEVIEEEARPEKEAMDVDGENPSSGEVAKEQGRVISQGLPSPPSSAGESEPMPGTQIVQPSQEASAEEPGSRGPVRRSTRQASRQPPKSREPSQERAPSIMVSREPSQEASQLPPSSFPGQALEPSVASPPRRRLRSASRDLHVEVPPPSPRLRTRAGSQQPPVSPALSTTRRTRGAASSQLAASQASQLEAPPPSPSNVTATPRALRRSTRRQTTPLPSSQVDQLDPSSPPIPPSAQPPRERGITPPAFIPETQMSQISEPSSSQTQATRAGLTGNSLEESPLFMAASSQIPQTQAYHLFRQESSSDIGDTPKEKSGGVASSPSAGRLRKQASLVRVTSPILEESEREDEDVEKRGEEKEDVVAEEVPAEHGTSDVSSDEEGPSIPIPRIHSASIYPSLPFAPHSQSQPTSALQPSSFPTLSSLPREALRRMKSTFGFSASQPESSSTGALREEKRVNGGGAGEESDSESSGDSSDEEPASLRGRFAGGKAKRVRKPVMKGW